MGWRPRPLLVYMLLNLIEERAYVGQTVKPVLERLKEHRDNGRRGMQSPLHQAFRRWPELEYWTYVVLQNCYSEAELDAAEGHWIDYCCTADTGVGYNVHRTAHGASSRKHIDLTEEQRQVLREAGKRGAAASAGTRQPPSAKSLARKERQAKWANMSADERRDFLRECGRKGGAASKLAR